jgi:hypothetical protein
VDRSITVTGLVLGIGIGFFAGVAVGLARRGWSDYRKTKNSVPTYRKAAWALVGAATTKVGVVGLLIAAAVAWAAVGPK